MQEVLEHRLAVLGVQDLGVELHAGAAGVAASSNAATGAPAVDAVTVKPAGAADTESPCDIQTDCSAGQVGEQGARLARPAAACGRTRSGPVCATSPPSAWAIAWKP